jgi:hypothetical protein
MTVAMIVRLRALVQVFFGGLLRIACLMVGTPECL